MESSLIVDVAAFVVFVDFFVVITFEELFYILPKKRTRIL